MGLVVNWVGPKPPGTALRALGVATVVHSHPIQTFCKGSVTAPRYARRMSNDRRYKMSEMQHEVGSDSTYLTWIQPRLTQ